jgi:hypothetical protein
MPKKGSDFEKRPALPDGSDALDPKVVVARAFVTLIKDAQYEEAVATGDTEFRDALVYITFSDLIDAGEVQLAEIKKKTGLTKTIAARVIEDRREKQRLVQRHGKDWHSLNATAAYNIDKLAGLEPEKGTRA